MKKCRQNIVLLIDFNMEAFDVHYTTDVVRKIIEQVLYRKEFVRENVDKWSRQIIDNCQQSLQEIYKTFKLIFTAMIVSKNDEDIHMTTACLWDYQIDGSTIIK